MAAQDKPQSPFAALAALKDSLPAGEARPVGTPNASATASPTDRRFAGKLVVARTRKGRGGKTVTTVRGIAATGEALESIARDLKKALGCGASVEEGEIVVQGEQEKRVAAWLEAQGATKVIVGT